ncbi:MAG: DUF1223 domain-containing protein [Gammaproteobacteria bacterium]|nr:DUF1223 domain-containing protein [Gammaproteobacteria bacterium]
MHKYSLMVGLLLLQAIAEADSLYFQSGSQQTQMIELYTSQGCSSCPPAEKFLNQYVDDELLWKHYIPMAFHVDYWDYLGWKDRYALAENTQRQYLYAQLKNISTVYTPGFVVNGKEWRGWRYQGKKPLATSKVGNLSVTVTDQTFSARFGSTAQLKDTLVLHYALLGMGLETDIEAGENRGRHSQHDFVVLWQKRILGSRNHWQGRLPVRTQKAKRYALVVWLSRLQDPVPLQAAASYL